ncbi:hypothetical protein MILUP08_43513 [Micromonospora lupini str. Lupac 08]|uniref:Uncharacterized protein n=1 Tax=Micromonospora lupini str. Lupac 08 TaxID=1150864 RepID=I0L455_9ACTN|nr:hypothetical protein MILUP08_43513 [Micromonospora lupini str. Lupac 08]
MTIPAEVVSALVTEFQATIGRVVLGRGCRSA